MAAFYLDHNVPQAAAFDLRRRGHHASTAREQRRTRANDAEQLRTAARNAWTLITRNHDDFELLHIAWVTWPQEWRLAPPPEHAGILVIPDRWLADRVADELDRFIQGGQPLANRLYVWRSTGHWERHPLP